MAIQSVKYGFPFPAWPASAGASPGVGALALDAAGEKFAMIYAATSTKAIRKIHFRLAGVTTGDTLDCRVETVDTGANGDPTGTLHTVNSNGACVVAGTDDNTWKAVTLTADTAALTIGEIFALVIVNGSVPGNMQLLNYSDHGAGFPYADAFVASWTKDNNPSCIFPEYSDGTFEPILGAVDFGGVITARTFKSDDATNRRGNIFQVAFPCRAKGAWAWVDADAGFTIKLYDSDGIAVLATTASANTFQRSAATPDLHFLPFTTSATLVANTNYRLEVVPDTTANIIVYDFDVATAGMLDCFPGGSGCHRSVYTSSAWVETTTSRTYLGVFLDGFSDGVGAGGGLLRNPGMSGGLS